MRTLAAIVTLALAGCCGTPEFERPPATGGPSDLGYLIDAKPNEVTDAQLLASVAAAESRLVSATVLGTVWPLARSAGDVEVPDIYGSGGDSALFTGIAAAAWAKKYTITKSLDDLAQLEFLVGGLYRLTHVTGTRGVVARCVLPLDRAQAFGWPWPHREPFVGERDGLGYYTRATRDQVSGLVFGLAGVWTELDGHQGTHPDVADIRSAVVTIGRDMLDRLEADGWNIRNENGENDTGADKVDGILRLMLESFVAVGEGSDTAEVVERLKDLFDSTLEGIEAWTNRFNVIDGYYAYNLRAMRTLTIHRLARYLAPGDPELTHPLRRYAHDVWWRYVKGHRSAWFSGMWAEMSREDLGSDIGYALRSWSLRPPRAWPSPYAKQEQKPSVLDALISCTDGYVVDPHLRKPTGYFTWQKEPWDVGEHPDVEGLGQDNGLSMFAAYWLSQR